MPQNDIATHIANNIDSAPAATIDGTERIAVFKAGALQQASVNDLVHHSGSGTVTGVSGTAPIASTGGAAPVISIAAATTSVPGSMSAADKTKLDGVATGATANVGTVTGVTGTAPVVSSGGAAPAISISAATTSAAGSMSAADKTKLDAIAASATANPPSYGGCYEFNEAGSAITLTSNASVYQWITGSAGTVKGAGFVTWDDTGKKLVVGASGAGKYLVNVIFSGTLATHADIDAVIKVNANIQNNLRSDQGTKEDGEYCQGSITGLVTLAASDEVSLCFGSNQNTNTWTVKHVNMTLVRIDT